MIPHLFPLNRLLSRNYNVLCRKYSSTGIRSVMSDTELRRILEQLSDGTLTLSESEAMIRRQSDKDLSSSSRSESILSPDEILKSFADIDHTRSSRTGFPEAVFGAGKTPNQIALILDDMARNFNEKVAESNGVIENSERAILATR